MLEGAVRDSAEPDHHKGQKARTHVETPFCPLGHKGKYSGLM